MTIQDQFCTKEQAIRLVELGVKAAALFYHMPAKDGPHGEYIQYGWSQGAIAPAFNLSELQDMMTSIIQHDGRTCEIVCATGHRFGQYELRTVSGHTVAVFRRPSLAQACAALLIYLLEDLRQELPAHWRQDPNDPCADGRCQLSYSKDMEEIQPLPEPTRQETETPLAQAIWEVLNGCTIAMPQYYKGHRQVTGQHVKLIVDAIREANG